MRFSVYSSFFMKKKLFVFLFIISVLSLFADFTFDLNLQPYKNAEFFADGLKIESKLISSDKTLGHLSFTLKDTAASLVIKKEGFRNHVLDLTSIENKKAFVVLSPINSKYDVIKIFPTGRKPKSVTFVNDKAVAVALLDGSG